jgi:hypothetical protein
MWQCRCCMANDESWPACRFCQRSRESERRHGIQVEIDLQETVVLSLSMESVGAQLRYAAGRTKLNKLKVKRRTAEVAEAVQRADGLRTSVQDLGKAYTDSTGSPGTPPSTLDQSEQARLNEEADAGVFDDMEGLGTDRFTDDELTTAIARLGRAATARGLLSNPALNDAVPPETAVVHGAVRGAPATPRAAPYSR